MTQQPAIILWTRHHTTRVRVHPASRTRMTTAGAPLQVQRTRKFVCSSSPRGSFTWPNANLIRCPSRRPTRPRRTFTFTFLRSRYRLDLDLDQRQRTLKHFQPGLAVAPA